MIKAKIEFIRDEFKKIIQVDLGCVPSLGDKIWIQDDSIQGEVRRMSHEIVRLGIENRLVHILVIEVV